jgi:hypothetical protein
MFRTSLSRPDWLSRSPAMLVQVAWYQLAWSSMQCCTVCNEMRLLWLIYVGPGST